MNFLLLSLSLLWIIFSLSILSSSIRKTSFIDSLDLTIAVAILFVITGIIAYLRVDQKIYLVVWAIFFAMGPMLLVSKWRQRRTINLHLGDSFISFVFIFVTLYWLLAIHQGAVPEFELYMNPDPTGYGIVSGATIFHSNFPNLLSAFQSYTGLPFDFNYNWDTDSFPLIDNPWHIPNALDKYGIANGFYLHNGASFLSIPLILFSANPLESFAKFWILITLIGLSLLISNIHQIVLSELSKIQQLSVWHRVLTTITLFALCSGVYWFTPFLLEGFANQILSFVFTLSSYLMVRELYCSDSKRQSVQLILFTFIILLLATFFVYAQQLPFLIYAASSGVLAIFIASGLKKSFKSIKSLKSLFLFLVLGILSWIILASRGVREAVSAFTNSAGGGAVHLGVNSPLEAIGFSRNDSVQINPRFLDETKLFLEFDTVTWEDSVVVGQGWVVPQQGYTLTFHTPTTIFFQIFIISTIIAAIFLIRKGPSIGLVTLAAPMPILLFIYLKIRTGQGIIDKFNSCPVTSDCYPAFSDYVWMRLLTLFTIFVIPVIIYMSTYTIINLDKFVAEKKDSRLFSRGGGKSKTRIKKIFWRPSRLLTIFLICVILQNSHNLNEDISNFTSNSRQAYFSAKCPDWLNSENQLIVSDDLLIALSLGPCAKPFKMLSDSFPVLWKVDGRVYEVIHLKLINEVWTYAKIGNLQILSELRSPCNYDCVINLPGFKAKDNVMYGTVE